MREGGGGGERKLKRGERERERGKTLEIRENLENEFPIFQSGKPQGI